MDSGAVAPLPCKPCAAAAASTVNQFGGCFPSPCATKYAECHRHTGKACVFPGTILHDEPGHWLTVGSRLRGRYPRLRPCLRRPRPWASVSTPGPFERRYGGSKSGSKGLQAAEVSG